MYWKHQFNSRKSLGEVGGVDLFMQSSGVHGGFNSLQTPHYMLDASSLQANVILPTTLTASVHVCQFIIIIFFKKLF